MPAMPWNPKYAADMTITLSRPKMSGRGSGETKMTVTKNRSIPEGTTKPKYSYDGLAGMSLRDALVRGLYMTKGDAGKLDWTRESKGINHLLSYLRTEVVPEIAEVLAEAIPSTFTPEGVILLSEAVSLCSEFVEEAMLGGLGMGHVDTKMRTILPKGLRCMTTNFTPGWQVHVGGGKGTAGMQLYPPPEGVERVPKRELSEVRTFNT